MKIKFTLFLLFISFIGFSQAPSWIWAQDHGGNSYDGGNCVVTDPTGNVYACGSFYQDTIILGTDTLRTLGLSDMFVIKYDPNGNIIWVKQSGGTNDEFPAAVTTDLWGNVYFVGTFSSTSITFGTTTLTNSNLGFPDIFLVKYNSNGNVIWAKKEGQADYDFASSVVCDPINGQPYIAGAYFANSITVGTTTLPNNGMYDEILIKYDSAGNVLWAKGTGGTLNDLGNGVSIDRGRNVYIAGGYASDSMVYNSATLINAGAGYPDIFTIKYDRNGNEIWARTAGGPLNDHSVSIANDTSGNVFVAGHYHSLAFNFASTTITNNGMGDLFLLKYDSSGTELWGKGEGGMDMDFGYGVTTDDAGNSYFAGMFISSTITVGSTTYTNAGNMVEDMLLIKYDPSGNVVWSIGEGGTGSDYINSVAINSLGNMYVIGTFGSPTMMLGATTLTNVDTSGVTSDFFIGKLDVVTGKWEEKITTDISIYPNPSTGIFTIQSENNFPESIFITNLLGELIYQSEILPEVSGQFSKIDLSKQINGIYFISIYANGKTISKKIIVQK